VGNTKPRQELSGFNLRSDAYGDSDKYQGSSRPMITQRYRASSQGAANHPVILGFNEART
jgi:hypothetical protein